MARERAEEEDLAVSRDTTRVARARRGAPDQLQSLFRFLLRSALNFPERERIPARKVSLRWKSGGAGYKQALEAHLTAPGGDRPASGIPLPPPCFPRFSGGTAVRRGYKKVRAPRRTGERPTPGDDSHRIGTPPGQQVGACCVHRAPPASNSLARVDSVITLLAPCQSAVSASALMQEGHPRQPIRSRAAAGPPLSPEGGLARVLLPPFASQRGCTATTLGQVLSCKHTAVFVFPVCAVPGGAAHASAAAALLTGRFEQEPATHKEIGWRAI